MILNKISIRKQLIILISLAVFVALVFASVLIFKMIQSSYKKQLVNETLTIAQMIGVNNQTALAFNDWKVSEELLTKLKENPSIKIACILTPKRSVFSTYVKGERPQWIIIKKHYKNKFYEFTDSHLDLASEIIFDNENIAIVYLQVSLDNLNAQLQSLVKMLLLVLTISYGLSLICIIIISNLITSPILNLAKVINNITQNKDYEIRVKPPRAKTEISTLYHGFNEMLDEIEFQNNEVNIALEAISEQKNEIEDQRDYILDQRDQIEESSRILNIWKKDITASITYSKNIQLNMLLPIDKIKLMHSNLFIFFKPRDIVSGDFYWFGNFDDDFIFCAADCTGHGVPGAMISVIGLSLLNQIIQERKIHEPHQILTELDCDFKNFFRKNDHNYTSDDGMDLSICKLNKKTNMLHYSGANNSAYIIRDKNLITLTADKHSLGSGSNLIVRENGFTDQSIQLQKNDSVFLYSDGYMDQFGGENGKKFMKRRFKELLIEIGQLPINEQHKIIEKRYIEWIGDLNQVDDILIIGVKI
jgi:serine phosphatase RsbU (regulator of sigma subunit)